MKKIVTLWELFQPIAVDKVSETDQASDDAIISHHVAVGHDFDL